MKTLIAIAASTVAAIGVLATPAHAVTAADCGIDVLAADARTASLDRLADKADTAAAKLAAGKPADALAKLEDFNSTLDALHSAPKSKLDPVVYATLNAEVEAALGCVADAANA